MYLVSTNFTARNFSSLAAAKAYFNGRRGPVTLFKLVDGSYVRVARRRRNETTVRVGESPELYRAFRKRGCTCGSESSDLG